MASETYEFYCVKCKAKKTAEGHVVVSENGRRMAKGKCPDCGAERGTKSRCPTHLAVHAERARKRRAK